MVGGDLQTRCRQHRLHLGPSRHRGRVAFSTAEHRHDRCAPHHRGHARRCACLQHENDRFVAVDGVEGIVDVDLNPASTDTGGRRLSLGNDPRAERKLLVLLDNRESTELQTPEFAPLNRELKLDCRSKRGVELFERRNQACVSLRHPVDQVAEGDHRHGRRHHRIALHPPTERTGCSFLAGHRMAAARHA